MTIDHQLERNSLIIYAIALPIGNPQDISYRAIHCLKIADEVVCENIRITQTLLRSLAIDKPCREYSEHTSKAEVSQWLRQWSSSKSDITIAWVSDCGTPNFADPGQSLLSLAHSQQQITISPIPGASSLTALLSLCDFDIGRFYYAGFLHRQASIRLEQLAELARMNVPVIIQDTPYRYRTLVRAIHQVYSQTREVLIGFDLSKPTETIFRGTIAQLARQINDKQAEKKREFIMILAAKKTRARTRSS